MFKVKEEVKTNGITLKGNMPDILTYLEREQERYGKIPILYYIRKKKLEKTINQQFGLNNIREVNANVIQR